jgi:tyrosinase
MDYAHFATLARDEDETSATASKSKVTNDINIEFIHNNIHYWVGGNGGHMSQIPVATFDPIFWLHHL